MTQETVFRNASEASSHEEAKRTEKKNVPIQELLESLKSAADDVGQISELSSEEKLLVRQFFESLMKLMKPLTPALSISLSVFPQDSDVVQAHIDPTGHLAALFGDGHLELKDLREEMNRDLMIAIVEDISPKFKNLTSAHKRKIEGRIKLMTAVTKEIQKIGDVFSATMSELKE